MGPYKNPKKFLHSKRLSTVATSDVRKPSLFLSLFWNLLNCPSQVILFGYIHPVLTKSHTWWHATPSYMRRHKDIHNFIKFNGQILADLKNKPTEYPKQPETKTVTKHAMSEVCLLPSPSYSRGRACKAQSKHKHFMKKRFSKSVCSTVAAEGPIFPKLVRTVFPKELLSASLFISFT